MNQRSIRVGIVFAKPEFNRSDLCSNSHMPKGGSIMQTGKLGAFFARSVLATTVFVTAGAVNAAVVQIPQSALLNSPGVYTPGGYYTDTLGPNIVTTGGGNGANVGLASGRNDDGFMALGLGFNVTFFGTTYNSLFVNNNGNVSFGSGISAYIPTGPTGALSPVISPWFSDVDSRNAASGVAHYNLTANQLVVTWDAVGRFNSRGDLFNSFQLVMRADGFTVPAGEGSIGFFYKGMGWESTDTSTVAAVGFGDGAGNGNVLVGSIQAGLNAVVQNKYIWFDPNLNVVPPTVPPVPPRVPEPGSLALVALALGIAGAGAGARRSRA